MGCGSGSDEVEWETTRDVAGAATGDQTEADQQWRAYETAAVENLDEMKAALQVARKQAAVDQQARADGLVDQIMILRGELVAESDASSDQSVATRARLEKAFSQLRTQVKDFLVQAGGDLDEIARWHDAE